MNEPIISPWIIYAIGVCNSIREVAMGFSILGVFAIVFAVSYTHLTLPTKRIV